MYVPKSLSECLGHGEQSVYSGVMRSGKDCILFYFIFGQESRVYWWA